MTIDEQQFPRRIQVFLPLLDGVDPIHELDLNEISEVLENLQEALGYGTSNYYGGTAVGPKGKAADLAARLDVFLDEEGGMRDVAAVQFETAAGSFDERAGGVFVPFGKTLSTQDYRIVAQIYSDESKDQSGGISIPHPHAPCWVWITEKHTTGVRLAARTADGYILSGGTAETAVVQLVAFGPRSTS